MLMLNEHDQDLKQDIQQPLLEDIARTCGTDKFNHGFCPFYNEAFVHLRHEPIRLLEVGIHQGASLRMWRQYFREAKTIMGIDLRLDKINMPLDGCQTETFDAGRREKWTDFLAATGKGPWDIIIDDGGHTMQQQQITFEQAWEALRPGGLFIIEDLHSSFNPTCNPKNQMTTWQMVNALKDGTGTGTVTNFCNNYITSLRYSQIIEQVARVKIWSRLPEEDKRYLSPKNSLTCIIVKR